MKMPGKALEGSYSRTHSADDQRPRSSSSWRPYKGGLRGGETPDGLAALGFDGRACDRRHHPRERHGQDRGARRDRQDEDFPGVTGIITIDEKRNAKKPAWCSRSRWEAEVRRHGEPDLVSASARLKVAGRPACRDGELVSRS